MPAGSLLADTPSATATASAAAPSTPEAPATTTAAPPPSSNATTSAAPTTPPQQTTSSAEPQKPPEAKPATPEKYELKQPEGSPIDSQALEETAAFSRELGLTNEQAQKLVDRDHQLLTSYVAAQQQALIERSQTQWVDEIKADKEIGGADFNRNAELARRAMAKFGSDSLKQALNESGLGSHPELVRAFVRIGKAMAEDTLAPAAGSPAAKPKSLAEIFYGGSKAANG